MTPRVVDGVDFGRGAAPDLPLAREVLVFYRGVGHAVWVLDRAHRPPHPDGVWLDDLVAESCRRLFGCPRGTCRPVPGRSDALEFREVWPDPLSGKVVERVRVVLEPSGHSLSLVVSCRAVPGCDRESLVFAEAAAACERQFGPGRLSWSGSSLSFRAGGPPSPGTVPCRYTVHRGSSASEVLVNVPLRSCGTWDAVVYLVSVECAKMFGAGRLEYYPDAGEDHFRWA